MKKFFLVVTGLCTALIIATTATAQTTSQPSAENLVSITEHPGKDLADKRVLERFRKSFPDAANEVWMKTKEGGLGVRFSSAGIPQLVFLNRKGDCTGSVRYLTEKDLPSAVHRQVKSAYYDYRIKDVREVTSDGIVAYLVTVEDDATWKIIRVVEDDMDVYEAHTKG